MAYIAKEYISQTKIYGIDKSEFSKYLKSSRKYNSSKSTNLD